MLGDVLGYWASNVLLHYTDWGNPMVVGTLEKMESLNSLVEIVEKPAWGGRKGKWSAESQYNYYC